MSTTLVTVAELNDHLFDADWCVVDCRHDLMDVGLGRRQYAQGHIPGAQFAHIDDDLSGSKTGRNGRHPLPPRDELAARFRAWGINDTTQIVAYDASGGSFAGRLWWLARWLGHENVALLDGGWTQWLEQTGWSSVEPPERPPGRFAAGARLEPVIDASGLMGQLGSPQLLVVDARARERYEGRVEPLDPVAGHIPGAVNRFWQDNLVNGRFKAPEQLRAEFEQLLAGRAPEQLVAHCGSGVTACHHLLAMHIAGLRGARMYAGSWSEWVADAARPVATGAAP
jgi:thiosulfate/3-mercaptopyruvate sulfurtransferase